MDKPSIHYMIVTFSRRDLPHLGITDEDIALLTEGDMEEIAKKLQAFYGNNFQQTLRIFVQPVLDRRLMEGK